jgi:hypothetical protein
MTQEQIQEIKAQLKSGISPTFYYAGVFKNQDRVRFSVYNTNDLDIQCYIKSCGCIGTVKMFPKELVFNIEARYEEPNTQILYTDGDNYFQKKTTGGVEKYYNLKDNSLSLDVQVETLSEVKASRFDRHTQIYFNDCQDFKVIDPDGMLMDNPEKASVSVQVIFWTLKD